MPPRRRHLLEDRPLRGLAPNPQPWYLDAVRPLAPDDHRPPDQRSDEELRPYCLSVRQEKQVAESTVRLHLDGSRFCYARTLTRPWPVFDRGRPRNIPKLPVVLSPRAGRDLLAVVTNPTAQRCLRLSYACGRRLREGPPRQVADIDPQRMRVPVRQGNGGQERVGPWPPGCWRGCGAAGRASGLAPGGAPPGPGQDRCPPPPAQRP